MLQIGWLSEFCGVALLFPFLWESPNFARESLELEVA